MTPVRRANAEVNAWRRRRRLAWSVSRLPHRRHRLNLMRAVRRHYDRVQQETELQSPIVSESVLEPIVVVPIDQWNRISERGITFALSLSSDVRCVHVQTADAQETLSQDWQRLLIDPLSAAGKPVPQLVTLTSPFRYILQPMVDYILSIAPDNKDQRICVLVPELVVRHWYENLMHNRRADLLKVMLLLQGNRNIVVINVPWYLDREKSPRG